MSSATSSSSPFYMGGGHQSSINLGSDSSPSPSRGFYRSHRANQSSISFGTEPSTTGVASAAMKSSAFVEKLQSVTPAGVPSGSAGRPANRRHTYLGGSNMASILGGNSSDAPAAPANTPPKHSRTMSETPRRSGSGIFPSASDSGSGNGVASASLESRRQTRRLMPEHQNGFKSSVFKASDDEKLTAMAPRVPKTPPALRSNDIFGSPAASSSTPSVPTSLSKTTPTSLPRSISRATQSTLVLGDDGGESLQMKKRMSYRRIITPPHLSKKQSFADFIGAPDAKLDKGKPKTDPAKVENVAGKSTGKHRVY